MPEFAYGSDPPKLLPPMKPERVADGLTLVKPLTRKGVGPGMIVLSPNDEAESPVEIKEGIPSLRMKWAEEGYCVVEVRKAASSSALKAAIKALDECHECQPKEKIGLVCYDTELWGKSASAIESLKDRIVCAAVYADVAQYAQLASQASVPTLYHLTGKSEAKLSRTAGSKIYEYGSDHSSAFSIPFHKDFHYSTEAVSHSRNLGFLKPIMGGPYFDLELLWDEHTYYEFEVRDVEKTMATMVQEPYVNHIPTITGGIGREKLTDFYANHFVHCNPDDTELELISRTVGIDRVVDEFIFKFTHDREIPWMLPGVPPTYKYVELPFTGVVNIRGDRLYHEHINWDQATALRQIGVLPEKLPLTVHTPAGKTNGHANGNGNAHVNGTAKESQFEVELPTTGADTILKMRDKNGVESNEMFAFKAKAL